MTGRLTARCAVVNLIEIYSTASGKVAHRGTNGTGGEFIKIFCKQISVIGATVDEEMMATRREDTCETARARCQHSET